MFDKEIRMLVNVKNELARMFELPNGQMVTLYGGPDNEKDVTGNGIQETKEDNQERKKDEKKGRGSIWNLAGAAAFAAAGILALFVGGPLGIILALWSFSRMSNQIGKYATGNRTLMDRAIDWISEKIANGFSKKNVTETQEKSNEIDDSVKKNNEKLKEKNYDELLKTESRYTNEENKTKQEDLKKNLIDSNQKEFRYNVERNNSSTMEGSYNNSSGMNQINNDITERSHRSHINIPKLNLGELNKSTRLSGGGKNNKTASKRKSNSIIKKEPLPKVVKQAK